MRYHLVGILGCGMSALAQILRHYGHEVSGSDRRLDSDDKDHDAVRLESAGIVLIPQDGSGARQADFVIYSTAVEDDNPDLLAAESAGLVLQHRAKCLAQIASSHKSVTITGTSGKTTVTAMTGWILEQAGKDPTVVNGGVLSPWRSGACTGSVRFGASDLLVIEADESDRSVLEFCPDYGVITNASEDHFDLAATNALFDKFSLLVKRGVVDARGNTLDSGLDWIEPGAQGSRFGYEGRAYTLSCPGIHNVRNALCAIEICSLLGLSSEEIGNALASFPGVHRRFEIVGRAGGTLVIDDFAHNPAKIRAAWNSVAPFCDKVVAVWRPHGFGPLASMRDALVETFCTLSKKGDMLFVLPVYYAGGTAGHSENSDVFVRLLNDCGMEAVFVKSVDKLAFLVSEVASEGDVVLVMGARDPGLPALARMILLNLDD